MNNSTNNVYQKREVCLMDIHNRIEKHHIDEVLNRNYQVTSSKIQKRLNVEFKTAAIARDVNQFLMDKELKYNGKHINYSLKGNRFLVDGMLDVPFDEIRNFFSSWGEVNNVYITKKYFAVLASISQAVELVEKIGSLTIDGTRAEIRYGYDRNIGFANSSNKNFEIINKDQSKFGSTNFLDSTNNRPIIQFKGSNTQLSKPLVVLGSKTTGENNSNGMPTINKNGGVNNQSTGNGQNTSSRFRKKQDHNFKPVFNHQNRHKQQQLHSSLAIDGQPVGKRKGKKNTQTVNVSNQTFIKMLPNPQVNVQQTANVKQNEKQQQPKQALLSTPAQQPEDVKLNSLKTNRYLPLFAKTLQTSVTGELRAGFSSSLLNKLDYNSSEFKSTDYLENKTKEPVHITTTYYDTGNSSNKIISSNTPQAANDLINTKQHSQSIPSNIGGDLLYDDKLRSIAEQISNYKIENGKSQAKSNEKLIVDCNRVIHQSSPAISNPNPVSQQNASNTINKIKNQTSQTAVPVRRLPETNISKNSPQYPSKKIERTTYHGQYSVPSQTYNTPTTPKTKKEDNCVIS